ncbi:glycosyltransferase [Flavobacteriaceae bacterium]|nr:glycosyltransferase [Flavobacteriaceae bacterium]
MKNKILIINNGFASKHIPLIINSFIDANGDNVKVIHNHLKDYYSFLQKVFYKLRFPIDFNNFNSRIINAINSFSPNLIIIIKGNDVYPRTLREIRLINSKSKIISWTSDNMLKPHNSSSHFIKSIPMYDIHFTTKSTIVDDFYKNGAKKVVFLNKAYSRGSHYPDYNQKLKFEVLFIGTYELSRYTSLKYLADNGIEVNIFGNDWQKINSKKKLIIHKKSLEGSSYRQAISSSKITLCFLRKSNDDLQTCRSVEIPACKGFMIAERTIEHQNLFKENEEAIYFESNEELLDKVKLYLNDDIQRELIAKRGYERAIKSDYSYGNMINIIMKSSLYKK